MDVNLGPLTTTFTAPPECASIWSSPDAVAGKGQRCTTGVVSEDPSCHPPSTITQAATAWQGEGYFSPGLFCPDGYATACYGGAMATSAPSFSFQYSVASSLGVAGCCPRTTSVAFQNCVSTPAATTTLVGATCGTAGPAFSVPIKADSVYAPMFQLVADMTSSGPAQTSVSAPAMSSRKSLSGGAIAGIVIGTVAGAFILLGCMVYMLKRARKNGMSFTRRTTPDEKTLGWNELSDSQRSELADSQRTEMPDTQRAELPDSSRVELPGSNKQDSEATEMPEPDKGDTDVTEINVSDRDSAAPDVPEPNRADSVSK